ncbi:hypothetical protein [Arthrobacter cavernae]|uniref:Uncharacterized protein n=1 Tax=Arthrobacter cavernae TaxID=2817681 RepID=A0A939KJI0_9MICC|nr:hypothetical protein [Arthrobacter cavernae]MBO1268707.1 hypothetical protein [Arthrobacter cavernae]
MQESARQTLSDRGDDMHRKGFTRAASISLRLVQDEIDAFKEQMKGPGLSKAEQALYAHLDELKSKIEADFDRYWRGSGVDWRPPKPVAKGIVRQAGESQP